MAKGKVYAKGKCGVFVWGVVGKRGALMGQRRGRRCYLNLDI